MYLGSWQIDNVLSFPANTHAADTGAATDADAAPAFRVYEDQADAPILTGTMLQRDAANTTGVYRQQLTLSAANGFELGKTYTIHIEATVGGVAGTLSHTFQMEARVHANRVINQEITDNLTTANSTPNFQKGYDENENTWIASPDFLGVVEAVPTPTDTQFAGDTFVSTNPRAYIGGRITFPTGSLRVHAQCLVTGYDGAGVVTTTPISGGAPGVGDGFHFSAPKDK